MVGFEGESVAKQDMLVDERKGSFERRRGSVKRRRGSAEKQRGLADSTSPHDVAWKPLSLRKKTQ